MLLLVLMWFHFSWCPAPLSRRSFITRLGCFFLYSHLQDIILFYPTPAVYKLTAYLFLLRQKGNWLASPERSCFSRRIETQDRSGTSRPTRTAPAFSSVDANSDFDHGLDSAIGHSQSRGISFSLFYYNNPLSHLLSLPPFLTIYYFADSSALFTAFGSVSSFQ